MNKQQANELADYIESAPPYIREMWGDQWVARNDDDNTSWP